MADYVNVITPVPGAVNRINVVPGDKVTDHSVVVVIEVMKIAYEVISGVTGVVESVRVQEGELVKPGDILVTILRE